MGEVDISGIKKIAVIMAGGQGDKLWPRSVENSPKQFNHFYGNGTLLQNTVARLKPLFDEENIYVVTNKSLYDLVHYQIPDLPIENIIQEPFGKNTAPCLGLAATVLGKKITDDTIIVALPADHVIASVNEYRQSLEIGMRFAYDRKCIVTIGITPTKPETGFGYVQVKEEELDLGNMYEMGVRYSSAFAEKPDIGTAKRFIDSGDFLWNSGIFIWRADTFWKAYEKFLPDQAKHFKQLRQHVGKNFFNNIVEEHYSQFQAESVDYAILEKADNVFVVKSKFGWSDLGNWDELYKIIMKDARNNFIEGSVIPINVKNCFVSSREKLIGIVGVEDLIVIEDENAIVICRRDHSDDVKEIVDFMKRKQITQYL